MPLHPAWTEIAMRLICAVVAGMVFGFDRSAHGRPAGLRTTTLVSVAACVAMIQANLLLSLEGRASDSFVMLDLMRLPLGILSGMGFIGAGAILRRENIILGVTTAATLWFVTVLGLCFGGGQIGLGIGGLVIGVVVVSGMRFAELRIRQDHQGTLVILSEGPSEEDLRDLLLKWHAIILSSGVVYSAAGNRVEATWRLKWRAKATETAPPDFVRQAASHPGIVSVTWKSQP